MSHDLTNLLPKAKTAAFKRGYFVRLGTVAIFLIVGLVIAHGLLLVPSYLFMKGAVTDKEYELSKLTESLGSSDELSVSARISALTESTKHLSRLGKAPSASTAIRAVLAVPRQGVLITGVTFTAPKQGSDGKMLVTGSAATRGALQSFKEALANLPFVSSADLPISSFAKETDIPFSISLVGTLTP